MRDLRSTPGNCLQALKRDDEGQHSIRIDDPFRICFVWNGQHAEQVEIVDNHRRKMKMIKNAMRPIHPCEVLREDFLLVLGMTANSPSRALNVPAPSINDIVREWRGISADTALRLARYFYSSLLFWLNLHTAFDLRVAEKASSNKIEKEVSAISKAALCFLTNRFPAMQRWQFTPTWCEFAQSSNKAASTVLCARILTLHSCYGFYY